MKLVAAIQTTTCLETRENVVFGIGGIHVGVGNGPDANMQAVANGKKGREGGRRGGFKRKDLNGSSFLLGNFIKPRCCRLVFLNAPWPP
ncbi:hypothetical protein SASPL_130156 [Salvia splendens]|uniref:Uncharacterized protein n=1 Tax=Salvia splendens TaxID=180675 RepID=A0A8X8ZJD3_SALSN|nr:hypothetical protein SASPL_130156 [Salvia splendens]